MYANYFNFSAMPFSLLPDSDFLFLSRRHEKVINMLDFGITTQTGFIVITGDVGAGKTTILRRFIRNTPSDISLGMITNPSASFGSLMKWVAHAFDLKVSGQDSSTIYDSFVSFLLAQYAKGKRAVLIIDEAQNMKADMLEELRMLSNVNNEKDQLLQMVLVGQPELLETLKRDDLRQFVQRVGVHCHLEPLNAQETYSYIQHRLKQAGGRSDLFDTEACAGIHHFSYGVPRLINLLCDQALVYVFSEDQVKVDLKTVAEVVQDRMKSGLCSFRPLAKHWNIFSLGVEMKGIIAEMLGGTAPVPSKSADAQP